METLLGVVGTLLRQLAFSTVFASIGWAIVKCLTLGRYPRSVDPRKADSADFMLLEMLGIVSTVGLALLLFWLRGAAA